MSTKKDLKTGAIFEIELDKESGYGYVKILISRDLDPKETYNLFIVKPYNIFSDKPCDEKSFHSKEFETDDILCFPLNMYFRPALRGVDHWRYIGMSNLTEEDQVIPDYVSITPPFITESQLKESLDYHGYIGFVSGLKNKWLYTTSYESVKHLGIWPHESSSFINRFLTIYWRKQKGLSPLGLYEKYLDGQYHTDSEFEGIHGGIKLFERDNESFQKMEKCTRLKALSSVNSHLLDNAELSIRLANEYLKTLEKKS